MIHPRPKIYNRQVMDLWKRDVRTSIVRVQYSDSAVSRVVSCLYASRFETFTYYMGGELLVRGNNNLYIYQCLL